MLISVIGLWHASSTAVYHHWCVYTVYMRLPIKLTFRLEMCMGMGFPMGMGITYTPMGMQAHGNILLIAADGHLLMFCIINNSKSTIFLTLNF